MPAQVQDTLWNIHTKSNGTITSGFAVNPLSDLNNITRGDTATFELYFEDDPLIIESNTTYTIPEGTTEIYPSVDIKQNGQLNNNGTLIETGGGQIDLWQDYSKYAGKFASNSTLQNTQYYRDNVPSSASIDTILLGFEPNTTLSNNDIRGVWGVLTNGTDSRSQPLTNPLYTLEVQVLAKYSSYADHTAVEADLLV